MNHFFTKHASLRDRSTNLRFDRIVDRSHRSIVVLAALIFFALPMAAQNRALNFDGVNDYVNCGPSSAFALTGNITLEAWVKPSSKSNISTIISNKVAGNGQPGFAFTINSWNTSDGTIWLECDGVKWLQTTSSVTLDTWQHIAVVVTDSTGKIYLNGVEQPLNKNTVKLVSSPNSLFIGAMTDPSYQFKGSIDEVRIWNVARTQTDIKNNINNYSMNPATSGLLAYYHFDQGVADGNNSGVTTLNDSTVNKKNGTLTNFALNGTTSNWVNSFANPQDRVLNFDGVDDYIDCGPSSAFALTGNITLEAWVKPSSKSNISTIISNKVAGNGQPGFAFTINSWNTSDGTIWLECDGASWLRTTSSVTLDTWQHIAVVVTGSTGKIYLNGIEQPLDKSTVNLVSSPNSLFIGAMTDPSYQFKGSIDEVRIWKVARTQTDIQSNMNNYSMNPATSGLAAYYHFNQGVGGGNNSGVTTLNDTTANSKNGTLKNFALNGTTSNWINSSNSIPTPAPFGENALNFDGVNDYVGVGNILPQSYTKEAWIKLGPTSGSLYNNIISGTNLSQHAFWANSKTLSAGHNGSWYQVTDGTTLTIGTWYHVAVTYDSATTTMKLYKNGVLISTNNAVTAFTGNDSVLIGSWGYTAFIEGNIDEVRIWKGARTQTDIQYNMNNYSMNPATSGLLAYYHFNQGEGGGNNSGVTTLNDTTANSKNGTLINFALNGTTSNWIGSMNPKLTPLATFSANMKVQMKIKKFDKAKDSLVVRGTFNGWGGNGAKLTDPDGDSIYVGSFDVGAAPKSISYKFVMISPTVAGDQWETSNDRKDTIPFTPLTLKIVYFNNDSTTVYSDNFITFQVNMRTQMNLAKFSKAKDSVVVRGDFNGWGGNKNLLADADNDGIYTGTYNITSVKKIIYKFVIHKTTGDIWPSSSDRVDSTLNGTPKTLKTVWFNNDSSLVGNVTFQVNMKVQMKLKKFVAAKDTVVVRGGGSFYNVWGIGNANKLTDADGDSMYTGTFALSTPTNLQYKYVINGQTVGGDRWEAGNDRKDTIPFTPTTMPVTWFDKDSTTQYSDNFITFQVNMKKQLKFAKFDKAKDSVVVRGDFSGWSGNSYLLAGNNTDSIYKGTFNITSVKKIIFKFVIHKTSGDTWQSSPDIVDSLLNGTPRTEPLVWFSNDSVLTGVSRDENIVVTSYELLQNYPNPFNPATKIEYAIKDAGLVSLKIYNVLGQEVATLVNEHLEQGNYTATLNASQLSSGTYFYKLDAGKFISIKKMILMK